MRKVLLIEDRIDRQKQRFGKTLLEKLNSYNILTNISGGKDFEEIKNQLANNHLTILDNYSTIMFHRSAFQQQTRNLILDYIKDKNKSCVLFSGGINNFSIVDYSENGPKILAIDVDLFYSDNLFLFLDNNAENILHLCYGKNWETAILIDTLTSLVFYIKSYESEKSFEAVINELNIPDIIKEEYFSAFSFDKRNNLGLEDLEQIIKTIKSKIDKTL